VLSLPYGDLYLHNPGRLRNLMALIVPVLGALGVQGLLERPPGARRAAAWVGAGGFVFLALPLLLGANPVRLILFAVAGVGAAWALVRAGRGARRAAAAGVVAVLALELVASAVYTQVHESGVSMGLEPNRRNRIPQPLHLPDVPLAEYLTPGPIASAMEGGRFLTWDPPAVFEPKAYLYTRGPETWPALENARGMLFGLPDTLGYSPVQLTRYWSYIRATNGDADLFYNAAFIRRPTLSDARLLGARYLIAPTRVEPPFPARPVAQEGRYTLYEIAGWQPLVSVVGGWEVADDATALREVLDPAFDPASRALLRSDPGLSPGPARQGATGTAAVSRTSPEHLTMDVDAAAPSLVVVRNVFDPDWTATVDGRPAPLIATDFLLQGIPVPAGRHRVDLVYGDPWIGRGMVASGAAWLGLGAALVILLARDRRRRGVAPIHADGARSALPPATGGFLPTPSATSDPAEAGTGSSREAAPGSPGGTRPSR
jgi:hypothetical protein